MSLAGLQGALHLNGRTAHVLGLEEATGRVALELELAHLGEEREVTAKEANLRPLPARPRTAAALQELLDQARDGSQVSIPSGTFTASANESLWIKSAITLQGQGPAKSVLTFLVGVQEGASGKLLHLRAFSVRFATLTVGGGAALRRARLSQVHVDAQGCDMDALVLNPIGQGHEQDRILVEDCEVRGGNDGVFIDCSGVRLLRCVILEAESRGIFANPDFVVEDCTVKGCGGYGMKTRSGCQRRGKNNIQPGPWDGHMQYG